MARDRRAQDERPQAAGAACGQPRAARRQAGFVRNHADKGARAPFTLGRAFRCALSGLLSTLRTQRNMKIHLAAALAAVVLGWALGIDAPSWAAIVLCIAAVMGAECFNTALESAIDLVCPDYQELARLAKDCAAGAVLVFALAALVVALIVFVPRLMALLAL